MSKNTQQTELIWSGKFTEKVKLPDKRAVDKITLPSQTIEIINEPREENSEKLSLFGSQKTEGWRNKLIWGDNKLVLSSLLKDYVGKINLIYIDPPFDVGADFSVKVKVGDEEVTKEPSILEQKAYNDTWGKGTDSYLQMMYDRLLLMRELLAEDGSIYVHLDWHVGHYIKIVMDEVFGKDKFLNEIIWAYRKWNIASNVFARNHDTILFYQKGGKHTFNNLYIPKSEKSSGKGKAWQSIIDPETGRRKSVLLDVESKGTPMPDYWEISMINPVGLERLGYDTQKPETLLERIIRASSNEGDLVADFFCGSGTTAAVAERLGRRWIMCDLGRFAIHTSRKRLMEVQRILKEQDKPYSAFEILNLGRYERQYWQTTIGSGKTNKDKDYIEFIIKLYKGELLNGFLHLHGKKDNRIVHIGAVDAPVTMTEVIETVEESKANKLAKVDILGWEWEMSVNEEAVKHAKSQGIDLRLFQIPKEVMEKQAVEHGDVKFFELDHMAVGVEKQGKKIKVKLTGFAIPSEDLIPDELREKITNWSDYVDYWSVDWDYESLKSDKNNNPVFENNWQTFRTKQTPKLDLETPLHQYETNGKYAIAVKAIDIFGNDTSKVIEVTIK